MSIASVASTSPAVQRPMAASALAACGQTRARARASVPGGRASPPGFRASAAVAHPGSPGDEVDRLLEASASGDGSAFERLYGITRGRLLGLAVRILDNRTHAEEVLQEAYLTVWQRAAQRRPAEGSGFGWMASIVRNRAIDRQRTLARDPLVSGGGGWCHALEGPAHETDERAVALAPLMARLSPERRSALRAAYFQGLSHREVADRLGVPLGTAKSWIRRGLSELRELLGP